MSELPEDPLLAEYVEAALEASCAALVELQLVRSLAADNDELVAATTCAIAALRSAITDLRDAHAPGANLLAGGFVLESESPPPLRSQEAAGPLQRSRRLVERARISLGGPRPRSESRGPRAALLFPNPPSERA